MTTRRRFLRSGSLVAVAGLSGCVVGASDRADRTPHPDHPSGATHEVSVTERDAPPALPVRPRVAVADAFATPDGPPVLRVAVDNPTDDSAVIGEYRSVVFQYVSATDDELVLLPHSDRSTQEVPERSLPDYETVGDGCWRLESPVAVTAEYGTVEVPPGGRLTAFVGLYGTADAGECLSPGHHRFGATYSYFPNGAFEDPTERGEWGFSLAVERL